MPDPTLKLTGRERYTVTGAYTFQVLELNVELAVAEHYPRVYRSDVKLAELAIGERVNVTDSHQGTGVWVGRIADADEDPQGGEPGGEELAGLAQAAGRPLPRMARLRRAVGRGSARHPGGPQASQEVEGPMAKTNSKRKPLTEEDRAERRERDRKLAEDAVERLASSDGWKAWLKTRGAFRRYSFNNQLLIALQRPDATRVAGFGRWRTLGYGVRKGERALYIWQPVPPSKKQLEAWREAGADPKEKPRTRFKLGPVFAREQVDPLPVPCVPAPLDPPIADLEGEDLAEAWTPLTAIATAIGVTVELTDAIPGDGLYQFVEKAISVRAGMSTNQRVVALVHELAHALVREDKRDGDPILTYAREELVAESVAFIVASGLGFDSSQNSIPYLAAYAEQTGPEAWQQIATLTDRLAGRIEEALHAPEPPQGQPAPVSADARTVGRFDPDGARVHTAHDGGPLRATRTQAEHDQRVAA